MPDVELPNVITPNGDRFNNYWLPIAEGMETLTCTIVNRWGNKVYILGSPTAVWDGTNMNTGQLVSDGVDSFVYRSKAFNGEEFLGHGFIHLIKKD